MQVLRKGKKGDAVKLLQTRLNDKAGAGLLVDGDFGKKTDTAVKAFQAERSLVVDGIVGDKTWDALLAEKKDPTPAAEEPPVLSKGSKGVFVVELQKRLNERGYGPLTADGDYGKKTQQSVWLYQESNNLQVDDEGTVDSVTWDHLLTSERFSPPLDLIELHRRELRDLVVGDTLQEDVVRTAIEDLGLKEIPNGSNGGHEIAHIVDEGGPGKAPGAYWVHWGNPHFKKMPPWCAISVSYWIKATMEVDSWRDIPFGNWFGGCTQMMKWAQRKDCWVDAKDVGNVEGELEVGSAFIMPRSGSGSDAGGSKGFTPGHTGLVLADNGDGTFVTIEGNTANAVKSRTRKISDMMGFVYWWEA